MARERGDDEATGAKRVLETGIALVHKGDRIWAEPDAQAQFAAEGADTTIHYHFPVEIEVRGAAGNLDMDDVARYVYERLAKRLKETG
jgi:hypothetical protein